MILYFSAMGNSRFVAKNLSKYLNDEIISLNDRIKKNDKSVIVSEKPYILVCPIYAWRIPKIVEEYLKCVELQGNKKIYVFVTTCGSSGNADKYARNLFVQKNMEYMGSHTFHMLGSYVAFMENPDPKRENEINDMTHNNIMKLIPYIKKEQILPKTKISVLGKFMSMVANPFFYCFIIGKDGFYITDKCIGCGKCEKVCPLNNINIKNAKPGWGHDCTHCMACVHQCPTSAIEFRKKTIGKNRYYNHG